MLDDDLTLDEAAQKLRMPRQSLMRLARAGQIGHRREGANGKGAYKFSPQDIQEYRDAKRVAPSLYMGRVRRRSA